MLRVKICGITRWEDAQRACALGADAVGFIFYPPSPRFVTLQQAAAIAAHLPPHVARVGVFVNSTRAEIAQHQRELGLHALQFHGAYAPEVIASFASVGCIKVVRVREAAALAALADFKNIAHAFLLDTYEKDRLGGTGKTFDWQLAHAAKAHGRIILAGGLSPANVQAAVHCAQPYALDVNSGVESAPGIKDHHKLQQLFEQVKEFRRDWQPIPAAFPVA